MEITTQTKVNSFYVIITGLFRYKAETVNEDLLFKDYCQWKNRIFNGNYQSTYEYLNHSYYDSYLGNTFPEIRHDTSSVDKLNLKLLNHLTLNSCLTNPDLYKTLSIDNKEEKICFGIDFVDLYLFPFEIGMFSIKFVLDEKENLNLGHISNFTNKLRHLNTEIDFGEIGKMSFKKFVESNVLHTLDQGTNWDIYNPQLKSYIMVDLADSFAQEELDRVLYDIGNISLIGSAKGEGLFAPSESYFNEQMNKNIISVFKNWSALSLFDSFTRISMNFPDNFKTWEYDFFNIYIHCLYIKFFMYLTNTEISNVTEVTKKTETLRDEFIEFVNDWHHTHISYKFLPDLIQDKLLDSLEIHSEIDRMEIKIQRINEHFQEKREKTMNFVLILITLLSILSLIHDMSRYAVALGASEDVIFPWGSLGIGIGIIGLLSVVFIMKIKDRK